MHERLDRGGPTGTAGALDAHLRDCSSCRHLFGELAAVQSALRQLPSFELDQKSIERVLAVAADPRSASPPHRRRTGMRLVPAAAALLLAVMAGLVLRPDGVLVARQTHSSAELERAAAEVELVLGLTGDALRRSREAAVRDVLDRELAPALRRIPLLSPEEMRGGRPRSS
jgi:predicted anti-sigma-YlaC factor YlaD